MLRGYKSLRLLLSGIKLASLRQYAAFNALSSLLLNASPHRPLTIRICTIHLPYRIPKGPIT